MGKGRSARNADSHIAICEPTVWKIPELRRLTTLCAYPALHVMPMNKKIIRESEMWIFSMVTLFSK
jgi:hypothetical protein